MRQWLRIVGPLLGLFCATRSDARTCYFQPSEAARHQSLRAAVVSSCVGETLALLGPAKLVIEGLNPPACCHEFRGWRQRGPPHVTVRHPQDQQLQSVPLGARHLRRLGGTMPPSVQTAGAWCSSPESECLPPAP